MPYLAQSRENIYWHTVFISVLLCFLKTGFTSAYFNPVGKVKLGNELLKF